MIPDKFTIDDSLSLAWDFSKRHWFVLTGMFLTYFILSWLLELLLGGVAPSIITQNIDRLLGINGYWGAHEDHASIRQFFAQIVSFIISNVFYVGYNKMFLNAVDGKAPELSAFSESADRIIPAFLTTLIMLFLIIAGVIALILPGIYLLIRLQYAPILTIDKKISPFDALTESWELTKGKFCPLFGQLWIIAGIIVLGILCVFVGYFFAVVVTSFICTFTYRMLQNENTQKLDSANEIDD